MWEDALREAARECDNREKAAYSESGVLGVVGLVDLQSARYYRDHGTDRRPDAIAAFIQINGRNGGS